MVFNHNVLEFYISQQEPVKIAGASDIDTSSEIPSLPAAPPKPKPKKGIIKSLNFYPFMNFYTIPIFLLCDFESAV